MAPQAKGARMRQPAAPPPPQADPCCGQPRQKVENRMDEHAFDVSGISGPMPARSGANPGPVGRHQLVFALARAVGRRTGHPLNGATSWQPLAGAEWQARWAKNEPAASALIQTSRDS